MISKTFVLAVSAPSLQIYINFTELCYEDFGGVVPIQHLKFRMKFITARWMTFHSPIKLLSKH